MAASQSSGPRLVPRSHSESGSLPLLALGFPFICTWGWLRHGVLVENQEGKALFPNQESGGPSCGGGQGWVCRSPGKAFPRRSARIHGTGPFPGSGGPTDRVLEGTQKGTSGRCFLVHKKQPQTAGTIAHVRSLPVRGMANSSGWGLPQVAL